MSLDAFVAGRYSATYATADVGITGQGYEIQHDTELDDVGETDLLGLSVIDAVWRGAQTHIQAESLAFKTGSMACFWPYGGALGANGVFGILFDPTAATPLPPGSLASGIARALVLTVTAGTPAATQNFAGVVIINTLTANLALLAKNNNGRLLFNSKLRTVPWRMRLYPYLASSIYRFFSTT